MLDLKRETLELCSLTPIILFFFHSSDETYGGELQWMVGLFEWADRIQTYDVDGWSYVEKLKEFCDGGYTDFSCESFIPFLPKS